MKEHKQRRNELKEIVEKIGVQNIDEWSFPFGYDGIKAINKQAGGRVSEVLRNASVLIEQGAKEGRLYLTGEDVNSSLGVREKKT